MPMEYQQASEDFERFLPMRDISRIAACNQTYTMEQGVLRVFRCRLTVKDAILFANVLPPVLRAIFVMDWHIDEPKLPFGHRAAMTREVQAIRHRHNFAPGSAIRDVAAAPRRHCDEAAPGRVLAAMPEGASDFWRVDRARSTA